MIYILFYYFIYLQYLNDYSTLYCVPNVVFVIFRSRPDEVSASDCLKKVKSSVIDEETACDTTLFKLLNLSGTTEKDVPLNFSNILSRITNTAQTASKVSCLIDLDRVSNLCVLNMM